MEDSSASARRVDVGTMLKEQRSRVRALCSAWPWTRESVRTTECEEGGNGEEADRANTEGELAVAEGFCASGRALP